MVDDDKPAGRMPGKMVLFGLMVTRSSSYSRTWGVVCLGGRFESYYLICGICIET